jgi:hypothetical protein
MERATLTVRTKDGINYDANHLSIERITENGTTKSVISFLCSGSRLTFDPADIEEILLHGIEFGASWCSECDQPMLFI